MAGIAGWIAPPRAAGDENLLGPMAEALAHRARSGETLFGVVESNARRQLVLGATLRDEASGISLVLDGGIVNARELRAQLVKHGYHFAEQSAEEVLLRAYQHWDKEAVKHLRGAFALAIWDGRKDRLLLARDRFGEKPLYLHERNGALHFASEPKALLKAGIPAKVDVQAVSDYLAYRYVPGPRTLFADIRKLPPATYGLWQFGALRETRYWIAPDRNAYSKTRSGKDPVEAFLGSLDEAVKLQSAGAIFLSGGLDSAVLVALMSRDGAKPRTFSLGFEGDRNSELPRAAQLAKHFGTTHHEIVIAPGELFPSLRKLVAHRDAPVSRPSDLAVHRLACEAARITKVVVTGDGCDEVLGGYRRYVAEINHVPMRLFAPLVSAGRFDTAAAKLKLDGWRPLASDVDRKNSRLRKALYIDQTSWLPDQLLERNDRATMAASVQARLPFLDHRLAEYVSSLPDHQRVRGLTTKWILRQAARQLIPGALRRRPKAGWRLDAAAWLRDGLRETLLEHLQGGSSVTRQYCDAATLDRMLEDHLKGKKNYETLLWTLLNIEIWHRTYTPG
jgi:asparagine synthase (glutamine-hydrolysing)